jgi:long-chain acyl-CoA synthetase
VLHHPLLTHARERPRSLALAGAERALTWDALERATRALAAAIAPHRPADPEPLALVLGPTAVETAEALLAAWRAGFAACPFPATVTSARLAAAAQRLQPAVVLAHTDLAHTLDAARRLAPIDAPVVPFGPGVAHAPALHTAAVDAIADPARLAVVITTSGSTGEPKFVEMTHAALAHTASVVSSRLASTPDDRVASVLPLSFSYGLLQLLGALAVGHALVLVRSFTFPIELASAVATHRATGLPAVPTVLSRLLELRRSGAADLSSLRFLTSAGAALPPAHARAILSAFPSAALHIMYGQTECARAAMLDPALAHAHPDSCGTPIDACRAAVVDDEGRPLPAGRVGQLALAGPNLMRAYRADAHATARAIRHCPALSGPALFTADLFHQDAAGLLYFHARTDDVFKCRGEKVAPRAVEHVLCELPAVREALVLPVEDATDGLAVRAVIVPRDGATIDEVAVRRHCKARLEPAMIPKFIDFADELPRTESGKVRRRPAPSDHSTT